MEKKETATSANESLGTPIMKAGVEISKKESVENKQFVQPFQVRVPDDSLALVVVTLFSIGP
jgi:hypothetical protein